MKVGEANYLSKEFEEDRRGRPGRYLQLNPEQPKHRCSPDHLKVDEEQWRIAQERKRQACGYGPHVRNLSGLQHPDALHAQ